MKKVWKVISIILDVILVLFVGVFLYAEVSMMITKNDPKNYGVPKAFGHSILYVLTNSMDDGTPNCLARGTGIIIEDVKDYSSLRPSTPIYQMDEEGNKVVDEHGNFIITDYEKDGDVLTFFEAKTLGAPDTHRLIEIIEPTETDPYYYFKTMGDRPDIHERFVATHGNSGYELWDQTYLIGKEVTHSKFLGDLLRISSPSVAASEGEMAWLFPVGIIAPIAIISITFVVDEVIKYRKAMKKREEDMNNALLESGIDLNDEEAVEFFKMKYEIRLELEEEKEKLKEQIRKQLLKENQQIARKNNEE